MRLAQLAEDERPRERLFSKGPGSLSVVELLAVLLGTGSKGEDVLAFSASLLEEWGGLPGLCRASPLELTQKKGLKKAKAAKLSSALELAKRISALNNEERPEWRSRLAAMAKEIQFSDREQIFALFLDPKDGVLDEEIISYGGQTGAFLDIPVFYRKAVRLNASSVVLMHNHPDGTLHASREDVVLTEKVREGLDLLGIELKCHYIAAAGSLAPVN